MKKIVSINKLLFDKWQYHKNVKKINLNVTSVDVFKYQYYECLMTDNPLLWVCSLFSSDGCVTLEGCCLCNLF